MADDNAHRRDMSYETKPYPDLIRIHPGGDGTETRGQAPASGQPHKLVVTEMPNDPEPPPADGED